MTFGSKRSRAGETLVETLAALLIVTLASVLLVTAIQSNRKINEGASHADLYLDEAAAPDSGVQQTIQIGSDSAPVTVYQTTSGLYYYVLNGNQVIK